MTARRTALLLVGVLVVYLVLVGWRGVLFVRTGDPVAIALGLAVLVLPVLAAVVVARELRFGVATQRMSRELEADGGLPVDDLPRRPSGRVEREAADATFAGRRAEVEAAPDDWRAWYRLAVAYDDAGDRRRAREAMRYAVRLRGSRRA